MNVNIAHNIYNSNYAIPTWGVMLKLTLASLKWNPTLHLKQF